MGCGRAACLRAGFWEMTCASQTARVPVPVPVFKFHFSFFIGRKAILRVTSVILRCLENGSVGIRMHTLPKFSCLLFQEKLSVKFYFRLGLWSYVPTRVKNWLG